MSFFGNVISKIQAINGLEPSIKHTTSVVESDQNQNDVLVTREAPDFFSLTHSKLRSSLGAKKDSVPLQRTYSFMSTIYRCVFVSASNIAKLPIKIMQKKIVNGEEVSIDITADKDFDIFRTYNDFQTHYDFWEASIIYLKLTGEIPWFLERNAGGKIIAMHPLRPDLLKVVPGGKNEGVLISHYVFGTIGNEIKIPPEDIFFMKYFNPLNRFRGLSPIQAAENEVILDINAVKTNKEFFKRGANPSGLISTKEIISESDKKRIKQEIKEAYAGSKNAGNIMFLTHGFKWHGMNVSKRDMQYMEQRQWSKESIMEVFGIPPIYVMQFKEASVLANADVQERLLWDTLGTDTVKIEQIITEHLLPQISNKPDIFFHFDLSGIQALQPNLKKKSGIFKLGFSMGGVSGNDFREHVLGLDRVNQPAMDQYYLPINLIPITESAGRTESAGSEEEKKINDIRNRVDKIAHDLDVEAAGGGLKGHVDTIINSIKARNVKTKLNIYIQRQMRSVFSIRNRLIKKFEPVLKKLFDAQEKDIIANLNKNRHLKFTVGGTNFKLKEWKKKFKEAGKPHIAAGVEQAGNELAKEFSEPFDLRDPFVTELVNTRSIEYADIVVESTHDDIDKILTKALADGKTIEETKLLINGYFNTNSTMRAARIARTEMIRATNGGRYAFMKQSDKINKKMWVSMRDKDVRDSHADLDGTVIKVGKKYPVGSDYNGDPEYPSDINERCFELPVED